MREIFQKIFALQGTPWYRWHPQLALRYLPVVEFIEEQRAKSKEQEFSILEVGSGGLGIAPYLKQPVTGVDRAFEQPTYPLLRPVIGDATKLKFKNDSFDVVVSMDMLEHLPKEKRQRSIDEAVRVARKGIVIGVPCGSLSLAHDKLIQESYKKRFGKEFPFAAEHIQFGLPSEQDVLKAITLARKRWQKYISVKIKGNLNLKLREFLMWGWISDNMFINIIFRKIFLLLIPIFRLIDRAPYYRKIFFITIEKRQQ